MNDHLPSNELFVQARDLLRKIAGETDAARMEVNAWEAMELSRKMRAAVELPPTLIPAPDLSEHIAWLREHIERLNALRDHLACRASEPPKEIRTTDATLNAGLDKLRAIANGQVLKVSPLQARLILDYVRSVQPPTDALTLEQLTAAIAYMGCDTDRGYTPEAFARDLFAAARQSSTKTVRNEACLGDGVPCASDGAGGCVACDDGKGNYRPAAETNDGLWNPYGNDGMRHMEGADVTGGATDMVGRCIHGAKHTDGDGCPHCPR